MRYLILLLLLTIGCSQPKTAIENEDGFMETAWGVSFDPTTDGEWIIGGEEISMIVTPDFSGCKNIKENGNKGIFIGGYMYGQCGSYTFTMETLECTINSGQTSCIDDENSFRVEQGTFKDMWVEVDDFPG